MTSTRHLIPDDTYESLQRLSSELGYKKKGKHSKWKLLDRLLAYASEHPSLFKL